MNAQIQLPKSFTLQTNTEYNIIQFYILHDASQENVLHFLIGTQMLWIIILGFLLLSVYIIYILFVYIRYVSLWMDLNISLLISSCVFIYIIWAVERQLCLFTVFMNVELSVLYYNKQIY